MWQDNASCSLESSLSEIFSHHQLTKQDLAQLGFRIYSMW